MVRHFLGRFLDRDSMSSNGEPETSLAQFMGLLAVPGAFFVLLFRPFGMWGWAMVSIRSFMISLSMLAMAFVMIFEWGSLFPDRKDFQIISPLPVRLWMIFLAKLTGLSMALGVFLAVTNFFSVLFWPTVDTHPGFWNCFIAHFAAVGGAGLFIALTIAALQGVITTLFWGKVLRRVSVTLQTLLMALLIFTVLLTPYFSSAAQGLIFMNSWLVDAHPVYWFAGLYELIRPATKDAVLPQLGWRALQALGIAALVFALTYLPFYRIHARRVIETPEPSPTGPSLISRGFENVVNRWIVRRPAERAAFHFITQTITRSMKHRLFLAGYGGLGVGLVALGRFTRQADLIELPLTMSFILISGLRAAFNFPAELGANWALQTTDTSWVGEVLRGMRKWVIVCAVIPLFSVTAVMEFRNYDPLTALYHLAFGLATSSLLVEVIFLGFTKLPFTCSYFPGKTNLIGLTAIYVLGLTMYSRIFGELEVWLKGTWEAVGFFAVVAFACGWLEKWREDLVLREGSVEFEDTGNITVQGLGLIES